MRLELYDLKKVAKLSEKVLDWYFFRRKESSLLHYKKDFKNYDFKVTLVRKI